MRKLKNKGGFTVAELLIVVAIIAILSGVSFISVQNHQRSLGQVERDGIAKEIFVAAQNHLTAIYGEGYLGINESGFGQKETVEEGEKDQDIYYFAVNGLTVTPSGTTIFSQMLPFGSIDEIVRAGGSYIIRYQRKTGTVLDVFYCSNKNAASNFDYALSIGEYATIKGLSGDDSNKKEARRSFKTNYVLGWYGDVLPQQIQEMELKAPTIEVFNEEKLYVNVANPNCDKEGALLKLIITGKESDAKAAFEIKNTGADRRVFFKDMSNTNYSVVLDDVTSWNSMIGLQFAAISGGFSPGEDIEIQAVSYSTSKFANVAYSSKCVTNSLYAKVDEGTAYIANFRHLENLDANISNRSKAISSAIQTSNLDWVEFRKGIRRIVSKITTGTSSESGYESVNVYDFSGNYTVAGTYMPIAPAALNYDGQSYNISEVEIEDHLITSGGAPLNIEYAGLFGDTKTGTNISNIDLIDFKVKGKTSAGALAGNVNSGNVTNVLARNSSDAADVNISAAVAGGLIGSMSAGELNYSAAALIVNGTATAGGLVGSSGGTITACYSGGHTKDGSYDKWVLNNPYDVTGATAGGLVGTYTGSAINNSYTTCSVSGSTVAGFAGSASGSINKCYATGLVNGTDAQYAFLAGGGATITASHYYSAINQDDATDESGDTFRLPMPPIAGYIVGSTNLKPLDLDLNEYLGFVSGEKDARAYDPWLVNNYNKKFYLETVQELGSTVSSGYFVNIHYGDWPAPEVLVVN